MLTRYAITHVNKDGFRVLTFANQGRNHYDKLEDAQQALREYIAVGDLRSKVLGDLADSLEVRAVPCYDHGDAMQTVWEHVAFHDEYDFTCPCGNNSNNQGAYQSDQYGNEIDGMGDAPYALWCCDNCGRIFDGDTGEVKFNRQDNYTYLT